MGPSDVTFSTLNLPDKSLLWGEEGNWRKYTIKTIVRTMQSKNNAFQLKAIGTKVITEIVIKNTLCSEVILSIISKTS